MKTKTSPRVKVKWLLDDDDITEDALVKYDIEDHLHGKASLYVTLKLPTVNIYVIADFIKIYFDNEELVITLDHEINDDETVTLKFYNEYGRWVS